LISNRLVAINTDIMNYAIHFIYLHLQGAIGDDYFDHDEGSKIDKTADMTAKRDKMPLFT
jgi:hypothetical protein